MTKLSNASTLKDGLASFCVFVWPFVFLFPLIFPDLACSLRISVDVMYFYYPKVYLLDTLSQGNFPLWSPNESAGFPFFSSPFNQAFYPLNFLMALWYKYMGGFSYLDYQRFSVLGLSLGAVFLYNWLRVFRVGIAAALFSTLTFSVSFKWVGILNRLNATHSAAWIICMLLGITMLAANRKSIWAWLILAFGTFNFLLANYPYYTYQSIFLFVPFFFMFFHKGIRTALLGEIEFSPSKYFVKVAAAVAIPTMFCIPILLKTLHLQKIVSGRSDVTIENASEAPFRLVDTFASFVLPAYSDLRGYYYFGFIGLLIIGSFLLTYAFPLIKKEKSKWIFGVPLIFLISVSLVTYQNGPIFKLLYEFMPGFGFLRVWSRLNLMLVPAFAFLLAFSFQYWKDVFGNKYERTAEFSKNLTRVFAGTFLLTVSIFFIQLGIPYVEEMTKVWRVRLIENPLNVFTFKDFGYLLSNWIAFALISISVFLLLKKNGKFVTALVFILLLGFTSYDIGWAAAKVRSYPTSANAFRKQIDVKKMNEYAFSTKRSYVIFLSKVYSPTPFSVLHGKRWYYKTYTDFMVRSGATKGAFIIGEIKNQLKDEEDRPDELDELLGVIDGKRLYFSENNDQTEIKPFLNDCSLHENKYLKSLKVMHYDGDQLRLELDVNKEGYLNFIDNWDEEWFASINENPTEIEKLFGTFKSLRVPAGKSEILFYYNPSPFSWFRSMPSYKEDWFLAYRDEQEALNDAMQKQVLQLSRGDQIVWQDLEGVNQQDDYFQCAQKGWNNSKMISQNSLSANEDGLFSFTVGPDKLHASIGFCEVEKIDKKHNQINYAFVLTKKGLITIHHRGRYEGTFGYYRTGDRLEIVRLGSKMAFRVNGEIVKLLEGEAGLDLAVKAAFLSGKGTIGEFTTSF